MKKVIVALLIISVLCLNGCKKLSTDTSSDISSDFSSIEYVDTQNDSSTSNVTSSINSTANTTTSSVVSDNSSDTQNTIIRPENVKTIYGFKEGITDHIKNTFYDTKNGNYVLRDAVPKQVFFRLLK